MKEWFQPVSLRELYVVEFQTHMNEWGESWADFAEDLQGLVGRTYPDIQEEACERFLLDRYLERLSHLHLALGVKKSRPEDLDAAVIATLQMESYKIAGFRPAWIANIRAEDETLPIPDHSTTIDIGIGVVGERPTEWDRIMKL